MRMRPLAASRFGAACASLANPPEAIRAAWRAAAMCLTVAVSAAVIAVPVFAQAPAASGQTAASVGGTIVSSVAATPVSNAVVFIEELRREARSGSDGKFTFANVPAGTYHLLVRAEKFAEHRSEFTLVNAPLALALALDPEVHYSEVVSVSAEARSQFDTYQPTAVLAGQDLEKQREATLGATLQNEPGLASRSLGPGPARPVIRGLDGDRVLILENGQRMGDLSSQSGDHGVNANPGAATRIEVVRGPATLMYGANAIGGLVNVITEDIPTTPVTTPKGSVSFDAGSAAAEAGTAADLSVGHGAFALHATVSGRRLDDYGTPEGEVPNSFSRGAGAGVGVSVVGAQGYLGANVAYDRTHYGVPLVEDGETNLDPRRHTFTVRGERRNLPGIFTSLRASMGVRRYRHDELDGDVLATSFANNTTEVDVLASHRPIGKVKGSLGGWAMTRAFSTEGVEALSPAVNQKAGAAFVFEEVDLSPHVSTQVGVRVEHTTFSPEGRFPARAFTNLSASWGLLVHPTDATTVALSVARAARNPALEELYFEGPHAGNFAFERGNASLESERALGIDGSLRFRGGRASGEITYFFNQIDAFIYREYTGRVVDDLPDTFFASGDAQLQGVESHLDVTVNRLVSVEGGVDYVRGQLTSRGTPLPRMPPLRGRLGVRVQRNALQVGVDAVLSAAQERVFTVSKPGGAVGETATDGSGVLKAFASYSFVRGALLNTLTLRLDNVTNTLYRNHLNYLKDLVPEVGRSGRVLFNVRF